MADTTIDRLQIIIESESKNAENNIDRLLKSLERVKELNSGDYSGLQKIGNAFKNLRLAISAVERMTKNVGNIKGAFDQLKDVNTTGLDNISRAFKDLEGLSEMKNFASSANSIGNALGKLQAINFEDTANRFDGFVGKLQALGAADMSGLNNVSDSFKGLQRALSSAQKASQNIGEIKNALSNFGQIDLSGLNGFVNTFQGIGAGDVTSFTGGISSVAKALTKLKKLDLTGVAKQIKDLVEALKPLTDEMIRGGERIGTYGEQLLAFVKAAKQATAAQVSLTKAEKMSKTGTGGAVGSLFNTLSNLRSSAIFIGVVRGVKSISNAIANATKSTIDYIEVMDLFNISLKNFSSGAKSFVRNMETQLGVNATEASKTIGTFMSLANSFGIASDQAYLMSKNLTQLAYDYSSAYNISVESAFEKLRSGFVGEIEPMRALGKDLSAARLQQELYNMGLNVQFESLTQADKATLRYIVTMKQSGDQMNNLATTINQPANMLRMLKAQFEQLSRTIGSLFIPMLSAILPYAIAVVKVLNYVAQAIANIFGVTIPETNRSGEVFEDASNGLGDIGDAAADANKELLTLIGGFDELNTLNSQNAASAGINAGSVLGDLELPEYSIFDGLVENKINDIVERMKEWLGITGKIDSWADLFDTKLGDIFKIVVGIGTAFAAWKIANDIHKFIDWMTKLQGFGSGLGSLGLLGLITDIQEFVKYFEDFLVNGATFENVTGMISEFAGALGDALITLGSLKTGGALKVVQGIGEIVIAIKNMIDDGVDWEDVDTLIRGLTNVGIGIGVFTGHLDIAGWSLAIQGFFEVIDVIVKNWESIKNGGWEDVKWGELVIGAIKMLAGIAIAIGGFSKLKDVVGIGQSKKAFETVADATGGLSTTVSTKLSPNLKSLAANLGLGLVVIAEVAVAAMLIAGSVIVLGKELEQVGIAWEPVIANGETVAIGMGLGVAALVAIGAVTALLGSLGKGLVDDMAIGTLILAELGVAAGLFIIEIWAIGKGLEEIGEAWQPVLDNGQTITDGIVLGTALLVGIGIVTAALGVATVASAGTLPIAIGLGTALLVELSAAFVLFTEGLVAVADELSERLAPALDDLNKKLPGLSENMSKFVDFMTEFADHVVEYTKVTSIAGLSGTVDTILGIFMKDPIEKFADEVGKIAEDVATLNEKLTEVMPELERVVKMMEDFQVLIEELDQLLDMDISLESDVRVHMNEVGQNIIIGLSEGMQSQVFKIQAEIDKIKLAFTKAWTEISTQTNTFFKRFQTTTTDSMANVHKTIVERMTEISVYWEESWENMRVLTAEKFELISKESNSAFANLRSQANSFVSGFRSDWVSGWQSIQSSTVSVFYSIRSSASSTFSSISSAASSMMSKIKSAISSLEDLIDLQNEVSNMDFNFSSGGNSTGKKGIAALKAAAGVAFASGGVVSEPTYALVGEYTDAKNNPEIIAPQSVIEQSVINANGDMVAALYDMATMIVSAVENNAVTVEGDADAMFKVVRKRGVEYQRNTGKPVFSP